MTALTDSEDEEQSDEEQTQGKLSVLLDRIDRLRQGGESDKRESLSVLLEQRDEVSLLSLPVRQKTWRHLIMWFTSAVWAELRVSVAADPSVLRRSRHYRHSGGEKDSCRKR